MRERRPTSSLKREEGMRIASSQIFTTVINCDTNGFGGLSGAFRFRLDDEVSQRNTVQRA